MKNLKLFKLHPSLSPLWDHIHSVYEETIMFTMYSNTWHLFSLHKALLDELLSTLTQPSLNIAFWFIETYSFSYNIDRLKRHIPSQTSNRSNAPMWLILYQYLSKHLVTFNWLQFFQFYLRIKTAQIGHLNFFSRDLRF